MNTRCYLYAITPAGGRLPLLGLGVDPRFRVETLCRGTLIALASQVGLDHFDLSKLEEGTADVPWLSEIAIRHDAIVSAAARHAAILPLRLGTVFHSQDSLLAKVARHEQRVAEFLAWLADRREWTVKIYLDEAAVDRQLRAHAPHGTPGVGDCPDFRNENGTVPLSSGRTASGQGAQYLAARRQARQSGRELQTALGENLRAVADALQNMAEAWRPLRRLPRNLHGRPQKMAWNAAFLLDRAREDAFQALCARLHGELLCKGLLLDLGGPWPAYHFCPTLDAEGDDRAAPFAGH
jgi:hypothetical protein